MPHRIDHPHQGIWCIIKAFVAEFWMLPASAAHWLHAAAAPSRPLAKALLDITPSPGRRTPLPADVHVTAHHCRIEEKPASFYQQFTVIILGLDSLEARRYMNSVVCSFLGERGARVADGGWSTRVDSQMEAEWLSSGEA